MSLACAGVRLRVVVGKSSGGLSVSFQLFGYCYPDELSAATIRRVSLSIIRHRQQCINVVNRRHRNGHNQTSDNFAIEAAAHTHGVTLGSRDSIPATTSMSISARVGASG